MEGIATVNDYLRREKILFKYHPKLWIARIIFIILVILSGCFQWLIMIIASAISIGYVHSSEMEHMLPMTDRELTARNLMKVRMVWLRYLIFGAIGNVYVYLSSKNGWFLLYPNAIYKAPVLELCFFILQMVYIYEIMLDEANDNKRLNGFGKHPKIEPVKILIQVIPHLVFYIYAVSISISSDKRRGILCIDADEIHMTIISAAALLILINLLTERKKSRICDHYPI